VSPPAPPLLATAIADRFAEVTGVLAVALGGSRAAGTADEGSDLDLYVYAERPPTRAEREAVAGPAATEAAFELAFWEPGDAWIDGETGATVDVMHRSPVRIEAELDRVLLRHEPSIGYSTAIWHNVRSSLPLLDSTGWYARLQARAAVPYPEPLRRAIVAKNHPILRDAGFSYRHQIEDALRRRDAVAVQHRLTALLASYFDVLFALNRQTHPGEKRLVRHALATCRLLPERFEQRISEVVGPTDPSGAGEPLLDRIDLLVDDLDAVLGAEGLR
jgi:predicted nucleotidyltransferase